MGVLSFYDELSKYYDSIFPPEKAQVDFICDGLAAGARVLDVACGTGGYSEEVYKRGFRVHSCDLDEGMVVAARARFSKNELNISVHKADMMKLREVYTEKFDSIFCIGNSIVHLEDLKAIKIAIQGMYELLVDEGSLILQIINFDRVRKHHVKELPDIKSKDGSIIFKRNYTELQNGKIAFDTELTIQANEPLYNTVQLLSLYKDELSKILYNVGFKEVNIYGDFNASEFTEESYLLVVKAVK